MCEPQPAYVTSLLSPYCSELPVPSLTFHPQIQPSCLPHLQLNWGDSPHIWSHLLGFLCPCFNWPLPMAQILCNLFKQGLAVTSSCAGVHCLSLSLPDNPSPPFSWHLDFWGPGLMCSVHQLAPILISALSGPAEYKFKNKTSYR